MLTIIFTALIAIIVITFIVQVLSAGAWSAKAKLVEARIIQPKRLQDKHEDSEGWGLMVVIIFVTIMFLGWVMK